MLEKLKALIAEHPRVLQLGALLAVFIAVENYAQVANWVSSMEQIEASESFGG